MTRERGHGFDVPPWWLKLALEKLSKEKGLIALGATLAKLVGREKAWDHTRISNVASGKQMPTQDLAEAISKHYNLPPPFFVPVSEDEAKALQAIHEGFEKSTKILDELRSGTEAQYKAKLGELEEQAARHTRALDSKDEAARRPGSRGPGRVSRRG